MCSGKCALCNVQCAMCSVHCALCSVQFEVQCAVPALEISVSATGASRRAAEQAAAKQVLAALDGAPAPRPARKRARKAAQLTLPVAVAQENK